MRGNANCTAPDAIYNAVSRQDNYTTWLVTAYAEPGYVELLEERLRPLGRRFLFEDRLVMNTEHPEDNYFTYILGKYITGTAATIIETHECSGRPEPHTLSGNRDGLYLATGVPEAALYGEQSEAEEDAEEAARYICNGGQQRLVRPVALGRWQPR